MTTTSKVKERRKRRRVLWLDLDALPEWGREK